MRIRFWGARGSTPTPERVNSRYGGNTPCIELRLENGTIIILDCGTGLRGLGNSLFREFQGQPIRAYIFLTHFHWDHVQGIPFFVPLYQEGNLFLFHSVRRLPNELQAAVERQMINPYFPAEMRALASTRYFHNFDFEPINVNGAMITPAPLFHPQDCVGYRVEADGAVFVLATDTEPGSPMHDRSVRELAQGADVLVYDSQYTPEQLQMEKKGWGHSSWLEGTRIARECNVKKLVLFHYDPDHDDTVVDGLLEAARHEIPDVTGAAEGLAINLPEGVVQSVRSAKGLEHRPHVRYQVELPVRISWQEADGQTRRVQGFSHNISRSGIYFVAPAQLRADGPLELDLILPDDITHRGDTRYRFVAQPVRRQKLNGTAGIPPPAVGVGAVLTPVSSEAPPI